jgi:hypothetical protein
MHDLHSVGSLPLMLVKEKSTKLLMLILTSLVDIIDLSSIMANAKETLNSPD